MPLTKAFVSKRDLKTAPVDARVALALKRFNPDQPRDKDGKWTEGGGVGASVAVPSPSGQAAQGMSEISGLPPPVLKESPQGQAAQREGKSKYEAYPEEHVLALAKAKGVGEAELRAHAEHLRDVAITESERTQSMAIALGDLLAIKAVEHGTTKENHSIKDANNKFVDYTDERKEYQDQIIKAFLADAERKNGGPFTPADPPPPRVTMLCGLPGSGKSFVTQKMITKNVLTVDPDRMKEFFPEYEGFNASAIAQESGDVADRVMAWAKDRGYNVIVDGTGKTSGTVPDPNIDDGMLGKLGAFKAQGYETSMVMADVTIPQSVARAVDRFVENLAKYEAGGAAPRWVPLKFIKVEMVDPQYGNKSRATYEKVKRHIDDPKAFIDSMTRINGMTGEQLEWTQRKQ